jgi:hypothetical protein
LCVCVCVCVCMCAVSGRRGSPPRAPPAPQQVLTRRPNAKQPAPPPERPVENPPPSHPLHQTRLQTDGYIKKRVRHVPTVRSACRGPYCAQEWVMADTPKGHPGIDRRRVTSPTVGNEPTQPHRGSIRAQLLAGGHAPPGYQEVSQFSQTVSQRLGGVGTAEGIQPSAELRRRRDEHAGRPGSSAAKPKENVGTCRLHEPLCQRMHG